MKLIKVNDWGIVKGFKVELIQKNGIYVNPSRIAFIRDREEDDTFYIEFSKGCGIITDREGLNKILKSK